MTTDETNILIDKAKTRKDGVYSYKGFLYVVKDNKFLAFSTRFGECFQRGGGFNISIGRVERYKRKEALIKWLKSQIR